MSERYLANALRDTLIVAESTRRSMQGNRATGTKPEETLRQALWQAGLRGYRKNVKNLPGKPDIVFGKAKLAIFVHGCYWHQCPHCQRNRTPKTNAAYWNAKFQANQTRGCLEPCRTRSPGLLRQHRLGVRVKRLAACPSGANPKPSCSNKPRANPYARQSIMSVGALVDDH